MIGGSIAGQPLDQVGEGLNLRQAGVGAWEALNKLLELLEKARGSKSQKSA
jgi:hypothetical protein